MFVLPFSLVLIIHFYLNTKQFKEWEKKWKIFIMGFRFNLVRTLYPFVGNEDGCRDAINK